jgi:hypothetical protein
MSYILFYSNFCKHSEKFIRILEQSGQAIYFSKINVDKNKQGKRPKIMYDYKISEVPSIIINNQILVGVKAFKWLQYRLQQGTPNTPMDSRANKNEINIPGSVGNDHKKVEAYTNNNGIGSNFADNFFTIGDTEDSGIYTPEETNEIFEKTSNIQLNPVGITGIYTEANKQEDLTIEKMQNRDQLKSKQIDNAYTKMMAERALDTPRAPSRQ